MSPKEITREVLDEMRQRIEYDPLTGKLTWKNSKSSKVKVGAECGTLKPSGYLVINFNGRLYRTHRVAWAMHFGENPKNFLDHINQNKTDNRIVNLREASSSENKCNIGRRSDNISGHRGINWDKFRNKWCARVQFQGELARKRFSDFEDAVAWINRKQEEMHKHFRPTPTPV